MAQRTIAAKYGYSRKQINVLLQVLRELGFINYIYRHMQTCLYKVSTVFENLEVRKKLAKIFPVLYLGNLSSLVVSREDLDKKVTQIQLAREDLYISKRERYSEYDFYMHHSYNIDQKPEHPIKKEDLEMFEQIIDKEFSKNIPSHNHPDYLVALQPILNLTDYGMEYVGSYPLEAISFAVGRIAVKQNLTGNPWNYFDKLLSIACQEKGLQADLQKLPAFYAPATKGFQIENKAPVNQWIARFSPILKKGKEKQATHQGQAREAICCANCQLNKTQPYYPSGNKANRICDRFRKSVEDNPLYNNAGELYSHAQEVIYKDWNTIEGMVRFNETVKLLGWESCREILNGLLPPHDAFPLDKPSDIASFMVDKIAAYNKLQNSVNELQSTEKKVIAIDKLNIGVVVNEFNYDFTQDKELLSSPETYSLEESQSQWEEVF